ncbi:hypothetical protein BDU57DRAFT_107522 [Ampelomyces quisqualis]|uniref:Uncharacterized protein n=1 Tax=Ampelomyces quisqualis TaxID=50730 RepID=A0A6A5Q8Q7_AMPQU|nr:hypothetical protein BDU57DRAFT_107522 [Ampelomyces quisqualis]
MFPLRLCGLPLCWRCDSLRGAVDQPPHVIRHRSTGGTPRFFPQDRGYTCDYDSWFSSRGRRERFVSRVSRVADTFNPCPWI